MLIDRDWDNYDLIRKRPDPIKVRVSCLVRSEFRFDPITAQPRCMNRKENLDGLEAHVTAQLRA